MKTFSKIVSLFFHPLFIPIYLVLVLFAIPSLQIQRINPQFRYVLIGLLAINNIFLPIAIFYILKQKGSIQSFQMESATEREKPYFILSALYSITAVMLLRINYLDPIISFIPIAAASTVITLIPFNRYLKISAHLASMGSAIGYLFLIHFYIGYTMLIPITTTILLAGIIASSRLYLKAHTTTEVYSGFILGTFITLLIGGLYLF
jgi:membrane-associated phospholipid phosphatase